MKRIISALIILGMCFSFATTALAAPQSSVFPTFSIVGVVANQSVTIHAYNFPANDSFDVRMNRMGTRGVNGYKVASFHTGSGGSFTATFNIPAALHGRYQIAIRVESNSGSGYYAYNWFYNNTTSGPLPPVSPGLGYHSGYPTFTIVSVERDVSVTIRTSNLPSDDSFKALMNYMGTRGVAGIQVDTFNTGSGGQKEYTFPIPVELAGQRRIAIRIQSTTGSGYYAYNWFYNNTTR